MANHSPRLLATSGSRFIAAAAIAIVLVSVVPAAAAQTQADFWNANSRTFYLHLMQYCDRAVSLIRFIDEFDWTNDLDGCGGQIQSTDSSWTDNFPSFTPLYANITGATAAEMHIFVLSRAVDQTSVEATLDMGYASCTGSDGPEVLVQEKVGGFHEFVIPCTFEIKGPADPMALPNLTVKVTATHSYGYGTEGDHASFFTLSNVEPAPPAEVVEFFSEGERPLVQFDEAEAVPLAALPPVSPKGNSPGLDTALTLVALAGLVLLVGQWRRRS